MMHRMMAYTTAMSAIWPSMQSDLTIPLGTVYSFALVLIRITGIFFFSRSRASRLDPLPPASYSRSPAPWRFSRAGPQSITSGVTTGVFIAWVMSEKPRSDSSPACWSDGGRERLSWALRSSALQAGYGYASTIDPNTQADSGILLDASRNSLAGLLFFAPRSRHGNWSSSSRAVWMRIRRAHGRLRRSAAEELIRLGPTLFSTGLRLALPITGMLLLVDLALALVGRINAQVQMITIAFPLKMGLVAVYVVLDARGIPSRLRTACLAPLFPDGRLAREIAHVGTAHRESDSQTAPQGPRRRTVPRVEGLRKRHAVPRCTTDSERMGSDLVP